MLWAVAFWLKLYMVQGSDFTVGAGEHLGRDALANNVTWGFVAWHLLASVSTPPAKCHRFSKWRSCRKQLEMHNYFASRGLGLGFRLYL